MSRVVFEYKCQHCPGDGVVRSKRPGIDWPTPCSCGARRAFTQYQLGRLLSESPKTIVRVNELRVGGEVAGRIFRKLVSTFGRAIL